MRMRTTWLATSLLTAAGVLLAACGGAPAATPTTAPAAEATTAPASGGETAPTTAPAAGGDAVTIRYGLWDANQQPAYEACAAAFTEQNPGITVAVEQLGWDDYWNGVQTGMVTGEAPDVFTNHLAKYPEFAEKGQIMDIEPMVQRDGVDTGVYLAGLADLWSKDGARYGLPKDWDTVAVIYNQAMLDAAGVTVEELNAATWNAQDGGTFTEIVKKLTLDANGNNALSADFDKANVVQYGFIPQGSGGAYGQTQWASFAVSNGFAFNSGPWQSDYQYNSPALAETMQWYADMNLELGVAPALADITSLGANALFTSGKGALTTDGSWMIGFYVDNSEFEVGFALPPEGPGGRKSMFNGLADSIFVGTAHPEEAWQWVKFAASQECADIVGSFGVVFPAQQSGVDAALAKYTEKGLDVSAFTTLALDPNATFLFPIADRASEVSAIMGPAMDSIMLGEGTAAEVLEKANSDVLAVFQ
jgi:multiple sugar transport system substrate-binding protein